MPASFGSCRSWRRRTPSVTKRIFVCGGDDAIEADLVADFLAERGAALLGDARGEHAGGEAAGLEHDDLARAQEAVIEQDLRDLRRFAGAGGSLEDEAVLRAQGRDDGGLKFVDGEVSRGHGGG